jgi:hypothetical protein
MGGPDGSRTTKRCPDASLFEDNARRPKNEKIGALANGDLVNRRWNY